MFEIVALPPDEWLLMLIFGALFIGALIGLVGVGGVLLPPLILLATDLPFEVAARICLGAFFFTGLVGTAAEAQSERPPMGFLVLAAVGAILGVYLSGLVPSSVFLTCLALLALTSGALALTGPIASRPEPVPPARLGSVAFAVGTGSAITGTGGPVLLTPLLLYMKSEVRVTSRLAQIVQLPIGTIGLFSAFRLGGDIGVFSILLGAILAFAAAVAQSIEDKVPVVHLRQLTGVLLCVFGLLQIGTLLLGLHR